MKKRQKPHMCSTCECSRDSVLCSTGSAAAWIMVKNRLRVTKNRAKIIRSIFSSFFFVFSVKIKLDEICLSIYFDGLTHTSCWHISIVIIDSGAWLFISPDLDRIIVNSDTRIRCLILNKKNAFIAHNSYSAHSHAPTHEVSPTGCDPLPADSHAIRAQ